MGQHRRVIRIIAVFMAIFTLFSFSAEDKNKARAEWMGGFVKMESADKAVAGNAVAALSLYKEALEVMLAADNAVSDDELSALAEKYSK